MATKLELAADIVSSHASTTALSTEDLVQEIKKVYATLQSLEAGSEAAAVTEEVKSTFTIKQAFKKDEVICMVCSKGKMKTLTRHLNLVHNMKPGEYRRQFGISSKQPLTAKSYSESRKKMAEEKGLAQNLAKAREVRAEKLKVKKTPATKAIKPLAAKKTAPTKVVKAKPGVKPTK